MPVHLRGVGAILGWCIPGVAGEGGWGELVEKDQDTGLGLISFGICPGNHPNLAVALNPLEVEGRAPERGKQEGSWGRSYRDQCCPKCTPTLPPPPGSTSQICLFISAWLPMFTWEALPAPHPHLLALHLAASRPASWARVRVSTGSGGQQSHSPGS